MKRIYIFVLAVTALTLNACSYYRNYSRNDDCEKMLKAYNRMMRFNEAEKAAVAFVDRPIREEYTDAASRIRARKLSMVDLRVISQECLPKELKAEATVEIDYFVLPDSRLRTVTDKQKWIYREEDDTKPELGEGWKLVSPFPDFK